MPRDRLAADMERDFYMSAAQAKEYGLIDDVRLSNRPLVQSELLWEDGVVGDAVVGHWTFEETPGFAADSSGRGRDLVRGLPQPDVRDVRRYEALVDLCHVLFNASEFLYVE